MKKFIFISLVALAFSVSGQAPPMVRNIATTNSTPRSDLLGTGQSTTQYVSTAISDSLQSFISTTNDDYAFSTLLQITNNLGLPVGVRVYGISTNTVTLEQVSTVSPINTNNVVLVLQDRVEIVTGPLSTIFSGSTWGAVGLVSKILTNSGGITPGTGKFVSTANSTVWFSNQPSGYWAAKSGGITWTNSIRGELLTGTTNHWTDSTGGNANPGTVWGLTNFYWIQPFGANSWGTFRSDGMIITSNLTTIP